MVKARVELGLTQEEAARAIGVDVRTLRRYESGEVNAKGFASNRSSRHAIVARIARELGVAEEELLVEEAAPPGPAPAAPNAKRAGHALPIARVFEGRDALVQRLRAFARGEGDARLLAIVGIGGAGKTALVAHALAAVGAADVLAWSFYDEPHVEAFLSVAPGAPPSLLVLDGLEVVQADGSTGKARGEIEDARLRRFLRDIASGRDGRRALVTSRFDLGELGAETGVASIALEPLTDVEASRVLRAWGVTGDVDRLARASGGHALATAMLASLATSVFDGDADRVASVDVASAAQDDAFARRLASVLDGIAASLSPIERDILACVAIYPRGVPLRSLERLARPTDTSRVVLAALGAAPLAAIPRAIGALVRRGLAVRAAEDVLTTHPILRAHFRSLLQGDPAAIHDLERRAIARDLEVTRGALGQRPATAPRDAADLDAMERFFDHTRWAGDLDGAAEILYRSLGGFSHLGLRLGAFERGLRMARAFAREATEHEPAPEPRPSALSRALAPRTRVRVAYEWGLYAGALGDLSTALEAYAESNRDALALGDSESFVTGLRTTAYTLRLRGDLEGARRTLDRSLSLCSELDLGHARVRGLALSAALFADVGDVARANEELATARALGDVPFARRAIWEAEVIAAGGDLGAAQAVLATTADACASIGWSGHAAHARAVLGALRLRSRDADRLAAADADLAYARAWSEATGEVEIRLLCFELELAIASARGDASGADRALASLRALASQGGFGWFLARADRASARGPRRS